MAGGPLAVQAFFIISGFYMALVLNERYDRPELNRAFYLSRTLRIYSLYALFLVLTFSVYVGMQRAGGTSPLWPYLDDTVSWSEKLGMGLLNLTIVGQDVSQFVAISGGHFVWSAAPFDPVGQEAYRFLMLPVSWSLALEIYFYALAPFIVRRPAWQIAALMAASLLARIAAAATGIVADPFSYRFFPFELAMFLAGALAYKAWAADPQRWKQWSWRLLVPALAIVLLAYPWLLGDWPETRFFTPVRVGTLTLLALALPAVHGITRNSRLDRAVGELSYPVYLSHELIYGVVPKVGLFATSKTAHALTVLVITIAVSWLAIRFIDGPVTAYRRRLALPVPTNTAKESDRAPGFA